ncbi:hypothetical protein D777_01399 [Marinobacter nitratireducens]|uniref:Uncharacterized protein n=1 Tax=Marinobacter nitratireducens TaxID=1137280 RepID=A0A072NHZ3_9GAMM|nr:hypothetical protein D777_01399 [Marinobacter nitratireducens]
MNRNPETARNIGDFLALEYPVANMNQRFGGDPNVLLQGQYQAFGQRRRPNRACGGLALVFGWVNAAGKIPEL